MALTATIHAKMPTGYSFSGGVLSITIPYNIRTSENTTPDAIRSLTGFPEIGTTCPIASGLRCASFSTEAKSGSFYVVTATFSNDDSGDAESDPEKPWLDPPTIEPIEERKNIVLQRAYANATAAATAGAVPGRAILTPAGELFDNPPQIEIVQTGYRISWAKQTYTASDTTAYKRSVNSDSVTINGITYSPQTLYLANITPWQRLTPRGVTYYSFTAEVKYDYWLHRFRPLLAGWKAKESATGKSRKVYIKPNGDFTFNASEGEPISEPILLAADGTLLAADQAAMQAATPVYGDYIIYKIKDWSGLSIPGVAAVRRSAFASRIW